MAIRKPPGKKQSLLRRKHQVIIASAIILSLFASWAMLAYSGAFDSMFRQKGKKGRDFSTASFNSNSPSKEYIYAGGRLLATEESGSGGCTLTSAPSLTTSVSSAHVNLSWTVPSGTASLEVQRSQYKDGPFAPLPGGSNLPPTTTSFQDNPPFITLDSSASNSNSIVTYIYRVVASDGSCSQTSNLDIATNISFAEPIVAQQSIIKATHLAEARVAVNAVWKAASLSGTINWTNPAGTNPQLIRGNTVLGDNLDKLRSNLDQALGAINTALVTPYSPDPSPITTGASGPNIKAIHFNQIRQRVKGN